MLEILQYYTSSFWVWAGITFGISMVTDCAGRFIRGVIHGHRRERNK